MTVGETFDSYRTKAEFFEKLSNLQDSSNEDATADESPCKIPPYKDIENCSSKNSSIDTFFKMKEVTISPVQTGAVTDSALITISSASNLLYDIIS